MMRIIFILVLFPFLLQAQQTKIDLRQLEKAPGKGVFIVSNQDSLAQWNDTIGWDGTSMLILNDTVLTSGNYSAIGGVGVSPRIAFFSNSNTLTTSPKLFFSGTVLYSTNAVFEDAIAETVIRATADRDAVLKLESAYDAFDAWKVLRRDDGKFVIRNEGFGDTDYLIMDNGGQLQLAGYSTYGADQLLAADADGDIFLYPIPDNGLDTFKIIGTTGSEIAVHSDTLNHIGAAGSGLSFNVLKSGGKVDISAALDYDIVKDSVRLWTLDGGDIYYNTGSVMVGQNTLSASAAAFEVTNAIVINSNAIQSALVLNAKNGTDFSSFTRSNATFALYNTGSMRIGNAANINVWNLDNAGLLGINTTTPSQQFDVNGNARFRAAIYDNANSAGTNGYILSTNGSNAVTWIDPATLASSTNYWTLSGSDVYRATGNVGIGTTSPANLFEVRGSASSSNALAQFNTSTAQAYISLWSGHAENMTTGQSAFFSIGKAATNYNRGYIAYNHVADGSTSNYMDFGFVGAAGLLTILSSGNIGIATTAPTQKLDINGAFRLRGAMYDGANSIGTADYVLTTNGTSAVVWKDVNTLVSANNIYSTDGTIPASTTRLVNLGNTSTILRFAGTTNTDIENNGLRINGVASIGNVALQTDVTLGIRKNTTGTVALDIYDNAIAYRHRFYIDSGNHARVHLRHGTDASKDIQLNTNGHSWFRGGNLGIGVETPSEALHVANGNIRIANTVPSLILNNGAINHSTYTSGNDWYFKNNSGAGLITFRNSSNVDFFTVNMTTGYLSAGGYGTGSKTGTLAYAAGFTSAGTIIEKSAADFSTWLGTATGLWTLSGSDVYRSTGFVGIGTSSPAAPSLFTGSSTTLHLLDNSNNLPNLRVQSTNVDAFFGADNSSLHIGTSGAHVIRFRTNGAERVILSSTGNVGIGETAPVAPLHVKASKSSSTTPLAILESTSSHSVFELFNATTGKASGTDGLTLQIGGLDAYLWNREAGILSIGTNNAERIRILSSGAIGIGTSLPAALVDISGAISNMSLRISSWYGASGANKKAFDAGNQISYTSTGAYKYRNTTDTDDVMTILSSGNVGIATTSPSRKLDVNGAARFRNAIYDNANSAGTANYVLATNGSNAVTWTDVNTLVTATNHWTLSGSDVYRSTGNVFAGKSTSSFGRFQVKGNAGNVYINHFESATTSGYSIYNNTTAGTTGGDGLMVGTNGLDAELINRETGSFYIGTANSTQISISSLKNITLSLQNSEAEAFVISQSTNKYIAVDTDEDEIVNGSPVAWRAFFNGYGTGYSSNDVMYRQGQATFEFPASVNNTYIHIEFSEVLTASTYDFGVEIKGSMPTATASAAKALFVVSYVTMNNTGVLTTDNPIGTGQSVAWYKHSVNGTPVLRISNTAGDVGQSFGMINVFGGYFGNGNNKTPRVVNITASNTATL